MKRNNLIRMSAALLFGAYSSYSLSQNNEQGTLHTGNDISGEYSIYSLEKHNNDVGKCNYIVDFYNNPPIEIMNGLNNCIHNGLKLTDIQREHLIISEKYKYLPSLRDSNIILKKLKEANRERHRNMLEYTIDL